MIRKSASREKSTDETVAESFPSPSAWRKAKSEIDEYHRLQKLSAELIAVNEKICQQRPAESAEQHMDTGGKKTAAAVYEEVISEIDRLLDVLFKGRRKTGHVDLEASEMMMRSAMHRAGAAGITELLRFPAPPAEQRTVPCHCGHTARYLELRSKPLLTAVGRVAVSRPYYLCTHCHVGQFPADIELDIENTEFSPAVRRMQALVGQDAPFDHGRQQIKLLADLEVTTKSVERTAEAIGEDIAVGERREIQRAKQLDLPMVVGKAESVLYVQIDATGVPVVKKETVGRQGKDGHPARHRDAKLGSVFTQTTWDTEGHAVRDPDTTTYVCAIETAEEFGKRIYLEAWKRGWSRAEKKVVIGDGAEWIWNIADLHFPGAVYLLTNYRAAGCGIFSYGKVTLAGCRTTHPDGPVAQLGARFHGMEEVDGSNPSRSTKSTLYIKRVKRGSNPCVALAIHTA